MKAKERKTRKSRFRKPSGKRRFQMPSKRKNRRSGQLGRHQESRMDRNVGRWIAFHQKTKPESKAGDTAGRMHPPETAGNHPDQGKATETVGAEDHTAAYY